MGTEVPIMKKMALVLLLMVSALALATFTYAPNEAQAILCSPVTAQSLPHVPAGSILLLNITMNLQNDEDSGNLGWWAVDNLSQEITLWRVSDGSYYVRALDNGTWYTFAGAKSPQNGYGESADGSGPFQGGYIALLSSVNVFTPSMSLTGFLGTFDFGGTKAKILGNIGPNGTIQSSGLRFWSLFYFNSGTGFAFSSPNSLPTWGWLYTYLDQESWCNTSAAPSSGDINTAPALLTSSTSTQFLTSTSSESTTLITTIVSSMTSSTVVLGTSTNYISTSYGTWTYYLGGTETDLGYTTTTIPTGTITILGISTQTLYTGQSTVTTYYTYTEVYPSTIYGGTNTVLNTQNIYTTTTIPTSTYLRTQTASTSITTVVPIAISNYTLVQTQSLTSFTEQLLPVGNVTQDTAVKYIAGTAGILLLAYLYIYYQKWKLSKPSLTIVPASPIAPVVPVIPVIKPVRDVTTGADMKEKKLRSKKKATEQNQQNDQPLTKVESNWLFPPDEELLKRA